MIEKVESSVMDSVQYLREQKELFIKFKTGKVYRYTEIDNGMYEDFMASESKGEFYNTNIKGRYPAMGVVDFPEPAKTIEAGEKDDMALARGKFLGMLQAQIVVRGGKKLEYEELADMTLFSAFNLLWPIGIQIDTVFCLHKR